MKKILTLVIAIAAFTSCIDGNDFVYNKHWDNEINALEKTDLPVTAVMQSAMAWYASSVLYYTEPNGQGNEYDPLEKYRNEDGSISVCGGGHSIYTFGHNTFREYIDNSCVGLYPSYWLESVMTEIAANYFTTELNYNTIDYSSFQRVSISRTHHWKILAYDENNIICETDFFGTEKDDDGIEYPYAIVHLKPSNPHIFIERAVTHEEYLEAYRQWHQDYWEARPAENFEGYIAHELETGRSTIEQLEAYFKYFCPEYYESTIKYILEKYK